MQIERLLEQFGLNETQSDVYFTILQMGSGSIQEIARKSRTKRTTTYSVLETLITKSLVSFSHRGAHREYFAEDPKKLPLILDEAERRIANQKKSLNDILPELSSFYNAHATKPRIRLYEGVNGLKQVFEETLELKRGEETLAYSTAKLVHLFLEDWIQGYVKKRVAKGITQRAIVEDSPEARYHWQNDKEELRETVIVPREAFPFSNEINIFRNKLFIISYKELLGVVIESEEIARTQKAIFELAWRGAKSL